MNTARVEIEQFQENLGDFVASDLPLAITRQGETIGFFVPALRDSGEPGLEALERAGELLRAMLAAAGVSGIGQASAANGTTGTRDAERRA